MIWFEVAGILTRFLLLSTFPNFSPGVTPIRDNRLGAPLALGYNPPVAVASAIPHTTREINRPLGGAGPSLLRLSSN